MYQISKLQVLSPAVRREVDALILESWDYESKTQNDVTILRPDPARIDPLDKIATHVLVRDSDGTLCGYGRVSVAFTREEFDISFAELGVATPDYPVAYISRLVVKPSHRQQGIANLIRRARIEIAKIAGARTVYGWAVGSAPRKSLENLGFFPCNVQNGFNTNFYKTSRTATLVALPLNNTVKSQVSIASGQ